MLQPAVNRRILQQNISRLSCVFVCSWRFRLVVFIVSLAKSMEETDNTFPGQYLEWIRNLKGIPPFTHELLTQHLITHFSCNLPASLRTEHIIKHLLCKFGNYTLNIMKI